MTAPHLPSDLAWPPQLSGVVPLGVDLGTAGGHRLVLIGLERWDGWADLRFARIDVGADRPLKRRVPPAEAWAIAADGRPVEVLEAVGRGDRAFSNGEVRLRPAPQPGAVLTVEVEVWPDAEPLSVTVAIPADG